MKLFLRCFQFVSAILLVVCICPPFLCGQVIMISGRVTDAATHRPVVNAIVGLRETGARTSTNAEGAFLFSGVSPGRSTVTVHHISFVDAVREIDAATEAAVTIEIELVPSLHPSEEMVVLSTRTHAGIDATPYPVTVATAELLQRGGLPTVGDAIRTLPGVTLLRDGSWETGVSIRGMGRSDIVALIDHTRIETANDIAGALSLVNMNDLERAEIVRSSSSTLYGTGAFGGVLHLVSRRASFADQGVFRGEVSTGYSGVNRSRSSYLALERSAGSAALRVSAGYRKADETETPDGVIPNSQFSDFSCTGSLGWKVTEGGTLQLTYQRAQTDDAGIPGGSPIAAAAAARYTLARRELFGAEYSFANILPSLPLVSIRLSQQNIDRSVEIVQSPTLMLTPHATHRTFNLQLESRLTPADRQVLVAGTEFWKRSLDSRRERVDKAAGKVTGERPVPASSYASVGAYLHHEWEMVPQLLTTTFGIRYDAIRVANDAAWNPDYIIIGDVLQNPTPGQRLLWPDGHEQNDSWSGHGGIRAEVTPWCAVSALASASFRSPSLEERFQFIDLGNVVRLGDPGLRPEKSRGVNVGVLVHNEIIRFRTDVYMNWLTDRVTEVAGQFEGRNALIKRNIGTSRVYGYECSGNVMLTDQMRAEFALSSVRGEDTQNHSDLPQIPPLSGNAACAQTVPGIGTVRVSFQFSADHTHRNSGEPFVAGYGIMGVEAVSVPIEVGAAAFHIRSGVENLFNRSYRMPLSTLRGTILTEPGRNVFLSLKAIM